MIEDGAYDVVVVDADRDPLTGALRVEVVIAAGPRRGEVVALRSATLEAEPVDLLGLPATLAVEGGEPRLTVDGA